MKIFDSHTHLNDVPFRGKEEIYLDRARELGVVKVRLLDKIQNLMNEQLI